MTHRKCRLPYLVGTVALIAVGLVITLPSFAQVEDVRSTWDCLPEETVAAVRIPNGAAAAEALMENTKFGAVLFSDERMEKVQQLLNEVEGPEDQEFADALAEYGLAVEDFSAVLAGESGYAVLVDPSNEAEPLPIGIGWLQPGEDLTGRIVSAIEKAVADAEDQEHPVTRIDLELADYDVMQLSFPEVHYELGDIEFPDDFDQLSEEEQDKAWDEAYEKAEQNATTTVSHQTALIANLGDRLLIGHAFEAAEDDDRDAVVQRLEAIFARLLAAHTGEQGTFISRVTDARGMESVTEIPGLTVMEGFADLAAVIELAKLQAQREEEELAEEFGEDPFGGEEFSTGPSAESVFRLLGFDALGAAGFRVTLDETQLHQAFFVAVPAPRSGLMKLVDQSPLPFDPPAWVPATAVSYSQFSFDLGQAYDTIREEVTRELKDEAEEVFQQADTQLQNLVQASLSEITHSLGKRIVTIQLMPQMVEQDFGDGITVEQPSQRMAVVWEVTNDDLWSRVLKALGTFAAFAPGVEATEEQGFSGWRLSSDGVEGGLVHGNGYLVLGIGGGVLETTLASINDPPTGEDALRNSELMEQAADVMELRPAVGTEIVDGNRYARFILQLFESMISEMEAFQGPFDLEDEPGNPDAVGFAIMKSFLPSDEEVDGMLGVVVTQYHTTDDGVLLRSVNDLPPPE